MLGVRGHHSGELGKLGVDRQGSDSVNCHHATPAAEIADQKRDVDPLTGYEFTELPQPEARSSEGHGGGGEEIHRGPTPGIREAKQWDSPGPASRITAVPGTTG
jgi:hypothetical protein